MEWLFTQLRWRRTLSAEEMYQSVSVDLLLCVLVWFSAKIIKFLYLRSEIQNSIFSKSKHLKISLASMFVTFLWGKQTLPWCRFVCKTRFHKLFAFSKNKCCAGKTQHPLKASNLNCCLGGASDLLANVRLYEWIIIYVMYGKFKKLHS